MGQTLDNGIYLPSNGERNCYDGLASNWTTLDSVVGGYKAHVANENIHITSEERSKWDTGVTQAYVLRYASVSLTALGTVAFSALDNTDNVKIGDKVFDSKGKLFALTAVDTQNSTFTIGRALIDLHSSTNMGAVALPIGSYIQFAGSQPPDGFLVCNGGEISRTTYSALFAVIGTTYGSGDGSTTFNLPNLTDRFLQGSTTVGTAVEAGLPNITCTLTNDRSFLTEYHSSGAFSADIISSNSYAFSWHQDRGRKGAMISIDASRSSSIYGNSSTVQPPALTCLICIKY